MIVSSTVRRFVLAALLATTAASTHAHQLWIGANNYLPKYPGSTSGPVSVNIYTTFGHRLPIDETIEDERFGGVYLMAEGAAPVRVATTADGYRSAVLRFDKPGAYFVVSANKPVFSTQVKDASGTVSYVRAPKTEVPAGSTLVDSTYIYNFAKTLIHVSGTGATEGIVTKPVGHTIEIVPLRNPSTLKKGDSLTVQIYYQGRPYAGEPIELTADHEGAAAADQPLWSGETDARGRLTVPLGQAGIWQFVVTLIEPATGELAAKTNQSRFRGIFTFEVPGATRRQ